jgi:hypothetical protein
MGMGCMRISWIITTNLDDCEKQDFVESFIANIASDAILTAGGVGLLKKIENVNDFTRYLRNRGTKNNIPSAICFCRRYSDINLYGLYSD